jgi:hypothetical protein
MFPFVSQTAGSYGASGVVFCGQQLATAGEPVLAVLYLSTCQVLLPQGRTGDGKIVAASVACLRIVFKSADQSLINCLPACNCAGLMMSRQSVML